jgi:hypothetical protein
MKSINELVSSNANQQSSTYFMDKTGKVVCPPSKSEQFEGYECVIVGFMTHDSTKGYLKAVTLQLAMNLQLERPVFTRHPSPRRCATHRKSTPCPELYSKKVFVL